MTPLGDTVIVFISQPYLRGTGRSNDQHRDDTHMEWAVPRTYLYGVRTATMVTAPKLRPAELSFNLTISHRFRLTEIFNCTCSCWANEGSQGFQGTFKVMVTWQHLSTHFVLWQLVRVKEWDYSSHLQRNSEVLVRYINGMLEVLILNVLEHQRWLPCMITTGLGKSKDVPTSLQNTTTGGICWVKDC